MHTPPPELVELVLAALKVNSPADFKTFHEVTVPSKKVVQDGRARIAKDPWQQFVVHARDSHGNPIVDYSMALLASDENGSSEVTEFEQDVHPFAADPSYRCFHVSLNGLQERLEGKKLSARITASTGTDLVGYQGYGSNYTTGVEPTIGPVDLDLSPFLGEGTGNPSLFCPFTTTLIEVILNREPMLGKNRKLEIFDFFDPDAQANPA
jgi:hypothetical protein